MIASRSGIVYVLEVPDADSSDQTSKRTLEHLFVCAASSHSLFAYPDTPARQLGLFDDFRSTLGSEEALKFACIFSRKEHADGSELGCTGVIPRDHVSVVPSIPASCRMIPIHAQQKGLPLQGISNPHCYHRGKGVDGTKLVL